MNLYNILELVRIVLIFSACFYIISEIDKLKMKHELGKIIGQVRSVKSDYLNITIDMPPRLLLESDYDYNDRVNFELFKYKSEKEIKIVTRLAYRKFGNMPMYKIDKMIKDFYANPFDKNITKL